MWPYVEDDHMEIGQSGWVSIGEGIYRNKYNILSSKKNAFFLYLQY